MNLTIPIEIFDTTIAQHGFTKQPGRSPHEAARYVSDIRQLIVLYRNGTVLVQGQRQGTTRAILAELVPEVAPLATQEALF